MSNVNENVKSPDQTVQARGMKAIRLRLFSCTLCGKGFGTLDDANIHIQTHRQKGLPRGSGCQEEPDTKPQMVTQAAARTQISSPSGQTGIHGLQIQRMQTGETLYKCSHCAESFYTLSAACSHILSHKTTDTPPALNGDDIKAEDNGADIESTAEEKGDKICVKRESHRILDKPSHSEHVSKEIYFNSDHSYYVCKDEPSPYQKSKHGHEEKPSHTSEEHASKRRHKCPECGKRCPARSALRRHMMVHSNDKPYISPSAHIRDNDAHIKNKKKNRFACTLCDKRYKFKRGLTEHMAVHRREKQKDKSRCPHCNLKWESTHSTPYTCSVCPQSFCVSVRLEEHIRSHAYTDTHKCSKCGTMFVGVDEIMQHVKTHEGEIQLKCSICTMNFNAVSSFSSHMNSHIGIRPGFMCNVCGRFFRKISAIREHMSRITKRLPSACPFCVRKCVQLSTLRNHVTIHQKAIHTCPQCNEIFCSEESLQSHLCYPERYEYTCCHCKEKFTHLSSLKQHVSKAQPIAVLYICPLCKKWLPSEINLDYHLQTAHQKELLRHVGQKYTDCVRCVRGFMKPEELEDHLASQTHTEQVLPDRSSCEEQPDTNPKMVTKAATKLQSHGVPIRTCQLQTKDSENRDPKSLSADIENLKKPHQCSVCSKWFRRQSKLAKHMMKHTGEKPHQCSICQERFRRLYNFRFHMRSHRGQKLLHGCSVCSKAFSNVGNLKRHMKLHIEERLNMYMDTETNSCLLCDIRFVDLSDLVQHLVIHQNDKPQICSHCGKQCLTLDELKEHLKQHKRVSKGPTTCSCCGKVFSQEGDCKTHMLTHIGEQPYKCLVCSEQFTQSSKLKTHMKTHTGEKPRKCSDCGKQFKWPSNLKKHMMKHRQKCSVCGKQFIQPYVLKLHMKTHTEEKLS